MLSVVNRFLYERLLYAVQYGLLNRILLDICLFYVLCVPVSLCLSVCLLCSIKTHFIDHHECNFFYLETVCIEKQIKLCCFYCSIN